MQIKFLFVCKKKKSSFDNISFYVRYFRHTLVYLINVNAQTCISYIWFYWEYRFIAFFQLSQKSLQKLADFVGDLIHIVELGASWNQSNFDKNYIFLINLSVSGTRLIDEPKLRQNMVCCGMHRIEIREFVENCI